MNVFDVLILAAVGVMLFLAIRRVRKNGKSGACACGCGGCTANCAHRKEHTQA